MRYAASNARLRRVRNLGRFLRVKIREVMDSTVGSPLMGRIKELLRQSKSYQAELARITTDLEQLQERIKTLGGFRRSM